MFWTMTFILTVEYITILVNFSFLLWENAYPVSLDESANGWKKMLMAELGPVAAECLVSQVEHSMQLALSPVTVLIAD